jgi:hypothetical protein
VFQQPSATEATTPGLDGAVTTPDTPRRSRIPVLMGRIAFTIRRW